eukprot:TRINITY_DN9031_c0_g1_i1.p1 TRINITY_DN9031_c0_g1~~TRINITY_DN9031_c0_g1_i1.p1  ORF type:complete len:289 (-),score=68.47 TRINITY_DN9031_c0_g1_i1:99-944(-)
MDKDSLEQHQAVGSSNKFVVGFYDDLAKDYQLIFSDWRQTVVRQAEIVSKIIENHHGGSPKEVLDCTCGIGTQAIGLAMKGYPVHATDISVESVKKAKEEAEHFGVQEKMVFEVVDLLRLDEWGTNRKFDVVMAMDNALAHFQKEEEILTAFTNMASKLSSGGLLMTSFRDYDTILKDKPRSTLPTVIDSAADDTRTLSFQVWDWTEESYEMSHYTVKQKNTSQQEQQQPICETVCRKTRMRAWQREKITSLLVAANLERIQWLMPNASGFYQPIVTAHKK